MSKDTSEVEKGTLNFTVDWPGLYMELMNTANLENLGHGGMMGLTYLTETLNKIGVIAMKNNDTEILTELANIGIIGGVEDINGRMR